jgi:hypothetical protein
MTRRTHILTTAAVLAVCAAPASAAQASAVPYEHYRSSYQPAPQGGQDLRSPDAVDAAAHRGLYEAKKDPRVLNRDYGSPDAADAARNLPPVQVATPTIEVREASGGFNWGDAGIGAAGMLALFSIAAGSALLLGGRRRRAGVRAAH